jgi:hypothetical protein
VLQRTAATNATAECDIGPPRADRVTFDNGVMFYKLVSISALQNNNHIAPLLAGSAVGAITGGLRKCVTSRIAMSLHS